uniref:Uncharacterized protein n=1 Tax=viral metagenome TaxID=1070528 RepID=A0A6C0I134_9ZZZZ
MESFFEIAKKELDLEKMDIEKILENSDEYSYLEGKSLKQLSQDNYDSLLAYPEELREHYYKQLEEYRLVEKVCDLRLGIYTKFLFEKYCKSKKGKGGILVKIDVLEDKISLLCKNGAYFQRYSFNDFIVFQKLSLDEKLVLLSFDY